MRDSPTERRMWLTSAWECNGRGRPVASLQNPLPTNDPRMLVGGSSLHYATLFVHRFQYHHRYAAFWWHQFGRARAKLGRFRAKSGRFRANLGRLVDVGRRRANGSGFRAKLGRGWPNSSRRWWIIGQNVAEDGPTLADVVDACFRDPSSATSHPGGLK